MSDRREDLQRDIRHRRDGGQVPYLLGHHLGASRLPVQRDLVDHEEGQRGILLAEQHAALSLHP